MFAKLAIFISALALSVTAAPQFGPIPPTISQCNVGEIHCCNNVADASTTNRNFLETLFGIDIGSVTGQLGLACNPISGIGAGGSNCSAQPVCCTGNNFNGAVVVGCTPINLNL